MYDTDMNDMTTKKNPDCQTCKQILAIIVDLPILFLIDDRS